jgi:hypothetical protein
LALSTDDVTTQRPQEVMTYDAATFAAPPAAPEPAMRERESPPEAPAESPTPVVEVPPRPSNMPALPPMSMTPPADSGLVLVETTHRDASAADAEEVAPRAKRVRPPRSVLSDEPLQLVETRKDQSPAV